MFNGLPAVLLNPDTFSRTAVYVYEPLHRNGDGVRLIGESLSVTWAVCDNMSERTSFTRANDWLKRASRAAMLPVPGTMLPGATNTGRLSSGSVKRVTPSKLRSTWRCCRMFTEYDPSMFVVKRASRMLPFQDRFERTVRGGVKSG